MIFLRILGVVDLQRKAFEYIETWYRFAQKRLFISVSIDTFIHGEAMLLMTTFEMLNVNRLWKFSNLREGAICRVVEL